MSRSHRFGVVVQSCHSERSPRNEDLRPIVRILCDESLSDPKSKRDSSGKTRPRNDGRLVVSRELRRKNVGAPTFNVLLEVGLCVTEVRG